MVSPPSPRFVLASLLGVLLFAAYGCDDENSVRNTDESVDEQPSKPSSEATTRASNGSPESLRFKKGQNNYTITVDGLKRQFIVHVPSSYTPGTPVPLVFVFHMSAHNGGYAYATTGWREQCDKVNCIAVFPTAMKYFVIREKTDQTKWNDTSLFRLVPSETPLADDVKFVQRIVETLQATFNIDAKRIYASGASNGGQFVSSRIVTQLPDTFAATGINLVLQAQGAPKNNEAIPSYVTYGSRDALVLGLFEEAGLPPADEFPMEAEQIMKHPGLGTQITNALKTLGLDSSYTAEYCVPKLSRCTATYSPALEPTEGLYTTLTFARGGTPGVELRFRMIKGMGHAYATPGNNPAHLSAAEYEWKFFNEHPKR